ncbi:hypothetical protein R2R35_20065 [Anaerocolumna sp. AGMB13020]|uniref:hypothetical protein n=1 Tax=Anaerocolumna sp. AGMB13020 TaxID=3081750 RepID=UPI002953D918|nr:hypothetical protein [Anaerocolumna sp. AGMB13020]WOO36069.1 hypothetical protein R2R35_20065 [Anaerocolumna sp. AGMB13020]
MTEGEFKSGNQNKSPLSVETQRIAQMIAMAGKGEGQQEESSREEKIYAVEFDGVICEDNYPEIGEPITSTIEKLKEIQEDGGQLILWTCRNGKELSDATKWCEGQGLTFNSINTNINGDECKKVTADYYIDKNNADITDI